jgi:hypothetical protein
VKRIISFTIFISIIFCIRANAQQILIKQLSLDFSPDKAQIISLAKDGSRLQGIHSQTSAILIQIDREIEGKYLVAVEVIGQIADSNLLISGSNQKSARFASFKLSPEEIFDLPTLQQQLESELPILKSEVINKDAELKQISLQYRDLKRKLADFSRLSRLVDAENTLMSLERRLTELKSDKQALESLISLLPQQEHAMRLVVLENELVKSLKELSKYETGAKSSKKLLLSPEQRIEMNKVVDSAKGLNQQQLLAQLQELNQAQLESEQTTGDEEQFHDTESEERGTRFDPL